jgi:hypothetical protein
VKSSMRRPSKPRSGRRTKTTRGKDVAAQRAVASPAAPTSSPPKLSPEDRRTLEADIRRLIADCQAPQLTDRDGKPTHDGDAGDFLIKMAKATGAGNPHLQNLLAMTTAKAMGCAEDRDPKPYITRLNDALAFMYAIGPETPVQGMLAAQMAAAHAMAMRAVDYASWSQDHDVKINWAKLANKFMATFAQQVDALEKLRGRTGTQTVRVEHVTVQAGGQAIVGAVSPRGEGGWDGKVRNDPMRRGAALPHVGSVAGVLADRSPSADEPAAACTEAARPGRRRGTRTR